MQCHDNSYKDTKYNDISYLHPTWVTRLQFSETNSITLLVDTIAAYGCIAMQFYDNSYKDT